MLRVRVELVPYGLERHAEVIEEVFVANDGTGKGGGANDGGIGNYDISLNNLADEFPLVDRKCPEYLGRIEGLIRIEGAHRLTMARTALERLERRSYQDHGLYKTNEIPLPGQYGHESKS